MFDLAAGTLDRPFRDKHAAASLVSVLSHVVVFGGIAAVVTFSVSTEFPEVPTVMAFVAELPAAPPPPPPPPAAAVRMQKPPEPASPAPATGPKFAAPAEVPTKIEPERAVDLANVVDEGGVVGGV